MIATLHEVGVDLNQLTTPRKIDLKCPLWGQKQTCGAQNGMSALPPKATSNATYGNVRFGPKADSCSAANDYAGRFFRTSRALPATASDVVRQQELRLRTLHSDAPKA